MLYFMKNTPYLSFSIKKYLIELNQDLDLVKFDIFDSVDYGNDHTISPFSEVLTHFEILTLYLEDRRFFQHGGVELRGFFRGLKRLIIKGKYGGISTIDQQVIRISTGCYERSISRKLKEVALAWAINSHCSKRAILHYYIHNAYLGYKIQGGEVAAQKLFGIGAGQLNVTQAAMVASLFPLPFPKSAWLVYVSADGYPFNSPYEILSLLEKACSSWVGKVVFRMSLALENQFFIPKNL